MNKQEKLNNIAKKCHDQLWKFKHIKEYLNNRLITDELIREYNLGYSSFYGQRWITIPVMNKDDDCYLIKLRKDPKYNNEENKFKFYPAGSQVTIYGLKNLLDDCPLVICEGEMDRLLLEAHGVPTISSTGGVATFKTEWIDLLSKKKKIWICFDNDDAGKKGAEKLSEKILEKFSDMDVFVINLPSFLGKGGDITDFMKADGNIDKLFYDFAVKVEYKKKKKEYNKPSGEYNFNSSNITEEDIKRAKSVDCSLFVKPEKTVGGNKLAKCPFHNEKTASFTMYPDGRGYACYGCGEAGDVISLVSKMYNLSFIEAVKYILNK